MKISKTEEAVAGREVGGLPGLPAMKTLGRIGGELPVVLIDTREQTPLVFQRLAAERGTLVTGDYSFFGGETGLAVERKSIGDLVGCCVGENRERFERELHRLRGFRFKRLLIVGTRDQVLAGEYRSEIKPRAVLNTVAAFEVRYDVPAVWAGTPEAAALLVEEWVWWYARERVEEVNQIRRGL